MQEEHRASVRITFRRHIHIGHGQPLAVARDHEHVYRIGIGEAFERDAEPLLGMREAGEPVRKKSGEAGRYHKRFSHPFSHCTSRLIRAAGSPRS